jgi:hypothetical protein
VEAHDDHFPQDAKDPELLRSIGARGWVLLTQDGWIRYQRYPDIEEADSQSDERPLSLGGS